MKPYIVGPWLRSGSGFHSHPAAQEHLSMVIELFGIVYGHIFLKHNPIICFTAHEENLNLLQYGKSKICQSIASLTVVTGRISCKLFPHPFLRGVIIELVVNTIGMPLNPQKWEPKGSSDMWQATHAALVWVACCVLSESEMPSSRNSMGRPR